jgi:hypothetical protein
LERLVLFLRARQLSLYVPAGAGFLGEIAPVHGEKIKTPYNRRDKKSQMVRAFGTYGRQERCIQGFGGET